MRGDGVIVAVLPGDEVLEDDATIGELQPDDRFEFVQLVPQPDGSERTTWVTGDAAVHELGPDEGRWEKAIATGIVVTKRSVLE